MRKLFLILFIIWALPCWAANVWYVHPHGDNSTGTSWATAKNYLSYATGIAAFANGDTIVVGGNPVYGGIMSHSAIVIDSLAYYNGWTYGLVDTSNICSATLVGFGGQVASASNGKIIGCRFVKSGGTAIIDGTFRGWRFIHCIFQNTAGGNETMRFGTANADTTYFQYCLFIITNGVTNHLLQIYGGMSTYDHCTFYGYSSRAVSLNTGGRSVTNCIFYSTYQFIIYSGIAMLGTQIWDYNIYYSPYGNPWYWETNIPNFSTWVDSLNNYGTTNESHSSFQDPLLQYVTTTCVPTIGSPAIGAASDGTDIGWYQTGSPGSSSSSIKQRIIIVE